MMRTEWTWKAADGVCIYTQCWQPEADTKAVICLVHGLGEHGGRYAHVAAALSQAGYALLAPDLRGHGKSEGQRGHIPSYEALLDDVGGLIHQATQRFPGLPRYLYGHSLGGTLALGYALVAHPQLAGVIATGAGLRSALEKQPLKIALARLMSWVAPKVSLASGLDPETISSDPAVVRAYQEDPLVHNRITFRMGSELLRANRWTMARAGEFSLPLLLMQAGADRLVFPEGSREFAEQVRADCVLKIWEGMAHEIHNEPGKEEVLRFMVDWLDMHTAMAAA